MLRVDVAKQLGEFSARGRVHQRRPGHRPVRRLRRRQDLADQHDRGIAAARSRRHLRSTAKCSTTPRPASMSPPHRRRIGYVFQDARLFPHLERGAEPRLRAAHERARAGRSAQRSAAHRTARHRQPAGSPSRSTLRRRAAACRARTRAVVETAACCCWTSRWDRWTRNARSEILPYLVRLRDEASMPMVYVSHDAARIAPARYADRDAADADGSPRSAASRCCRARDLQVDCRGRHRRCTLALMPLRQPERARSPTACA